jgi:hypothetical protein
VESDAKKMSKDSFIRDMRRIIDKAKNRNDVFVRRLALEIDRRLVLKSPVDTGRFRANWNIGYGALNVTITNDTDKTGSKSIGKANSELLQAKAGMQIFISNSLPYAQRLEDGWSKQSPFGMVKLTVEEFKPIANRLASEIRAS